MSSLIRKLSIVVKIVYSIILELALLNGMSSLIQKLCIVVEIVYCVMLESALLQLWFYLYV